MSNAIKKAPIDTDILAQLKSNEGYNGYRIHAMLDTLHPEYKDARGGWSGYYDVRSDRTRIGTGSRSHRHIPITYKTDKGAYNFVMKKLGR